MDSPSATPEPMQQPMPAPAPKRTRMVVGVVVGVVIIVVIIAAVFLLRGGGVTRNMTVTQFNTEMQAEFANANAGDTIRVTGTITDLTDNPIGPGSLVSLDGTLMTIFVDPPASCAVGDGLTMTLHVVVITYQGQTGKWFQELGTIPDPQNVTVPATAVTCT